MGFIPGIQVASKFVKNSKGPLDGKMSLVDADRLALTEVQREIGMIVNVKGTTSWKILINDPTGQDFTVEADWEDFYGSKCNMFSQDITIGDSSPSVTVNHALGTYNLHITTYELPQHEKVLVDVSLPDINSATFTGSGTDRTIKVIIGQCEGQGGENNFSYYRIDAGETITVPDGQQMIVADKIIDIQGTLDVQGEVNNPMHGSVASSLNDLTDTDISSQNNGDILIYDFASSMWINKQPVLNDLADVNTVGVSSDDTLIYDGSNWVPTPFPSKYWTNVSNILSNNGSDSNISFDDFVVGSPTLDDDGNSGHQTKLFLDKGKSAFRAGKVQGSFWDNINIGQYSFSSGLNTSAKGYAGFAGGQYSNVDKFSGISLGNSSHAYEDNNISIGPGARTRGTGSVQIGPGSAETYQEISIGYYPVSYPIYDRYNYDIRDVGVSIGYGANSSDRKSVFTAFKNGTVYLESFSLFRKGFGYNAITYSSNTIIGANESIIYGDAGGGNITLTLPANPITGRTIIIKRIDSIILNDLTIDGNGRTIDGSTTKTLSSNKAYTLHFYSDWHIISQV